MPLTKSAMASSLPSWEATACTTSARFGPLVSRMSGRSAALATQSAVELEDAAAEH